MLEAELKTLNRLTMPDGTMFEKGKRKPITASLARRFLNDSRFTVHGLDSLLDQAAAVPEVDTGKPDGAALRALIRSAVDDLDADDENFEDNGKPKVEVLSKILGFEVTVGDRDMAMSAQTAQPKIDAVEPKRMRVIRARPAVPPENPEPSVEV